MSFNLGALVGELKLDMKGFVRNTRRGAKATKDVTRSLRRMEDQGGRTKRQMLNVGITMNRLAQSAAALAGGAGMVALGRSFIRTASRVENMEMVLQGLLGTQEEAAKGFENMKNFASQVPFQLQEIMDSYTMLAGIMEGGREQVESWLPLISDLAAARPDIGFQKTTSQIMRMLSAGAQAADLFRERGVLGMLGFTGGVSYTVEETRRKIVEAYADINSKFRGASERLAKTWTGTISMMQDKWFQFRLAVMNSGIFAFISRGLRTVNALGDRHKEALETWAQRYGSLAASIVGVTTAVVGLGAAIGILNVTGIISGIRATSAALGGLIVRLATMNTVELVRATTGVNKFSAGLLLTSKRGGILASVLKSSLIPVLAAIAGSTLFLKNAWQRDWNGIKTNTMNVIDSIRGWISDLVGDFKWLANIVKWLGGVFKEAAEETKSFRDMGKDLDPKNLGTNNIAVLTDNVETLTKRLKALRRESTQTVLPHGIAKRDPTEGEKERISRLEERIALTKEMISLQRRVGEFREAGGLLQGMGATAAGMPQVQAIAMAEHLQLQEASYAIQEKLVDFQNDMSTEVKGAFEAAFDPDMWGPPEINMDQFIEGAEIFKTGEGTTGEGIAGPLRDSIEDVMSIFPDLGIGLGEEWAKQATKGISEADDVAQEEIDKMLSNMKTSAEEGAKALGEVDILEYGPKVPKDFWSRYITRASDFRDQLEPTRNAVSELTKNLLALKMTGSLEEVQEQNLLAPFYWQQWREYAETSPQLFNELMEAMSKIAPETAEQISFLKQHYDLSVKATKKAEEAKQKKREEEAAFTDTISNVISSGRQMAEIGDLVGDEFTKGFGSAISSAGQFVSSLDDTLNAISALKEGGSGMTQAMNFTQMASGALGAVGAVMNLVSAFGILEEEQEEVKVGWEKAMDEMKNSISEWADDLTDAIIEFVKTGKFEFKEFVNSVLEDMLRITIRHGIMGPALSALGVEGAAKGGIVQDPTFLSNGSKAGVMGEAGPEAIMPLTRLADGSLGVQAGSTSGDVQVIINNDGPPISAEVEETGQTEDGRTLVKMAVRSELVEAYNDGFMDSLNRAHYRGVQRKGR